ncbi:RHTO0S11e06128g1_1 [Rhodotorula toruloides]|uniref:Mediator of RNA polymerase II transcription subunit 5 n=1 Tax=Rhodotorula toruloides TaxID=5286 RepID=A0A061B945_RHOTO|nr:RHTO0S11e06128g1_1 [Rhodotorula toruloides]
MTLDSRPRSIDAVTRACYARGLPSPTWVSLVRDTAQAQELPKEDAERDITHSLLVLLANSPFPPPLLAQYIQTALGSAALARPGYVASIIASRVPALALPAAEVAFSAINQALASAPSQPSYPSDTPAETAQAVELVLNSLLPLVLSSPTSALETIRYLSYFLSHLPHRLTKDTVDAEQLEICAKTVRTAVEAVSKVGPKDAPVLAKLRHELEALERKLKPRGRRRVPSKVDLDEADELEALGTPYGDVALLVSRMLSNPLIPTQQLHSSLLALIRYRTAQSTFRKSTPEKALVHLLAEVLGGLIQTLQDAKRADVVLESLLFAKVPHVLKSLSTVDGLDKLSEALADALRLVQGRLAKAISEGRRDMDSSVPSVFSHFVAACCQSDLLLPDIGASLARDVDVSELQPTMIEDYHHRLATGSIDDFKQVLDDAVHSYAAQHAIASAITSLFAAKAQSADLAGLADLCDTLAENKDAMSVVFLHVEPRELLRPVRQVLDSFDTTQENSDDVNPIERYGSLVLFVQLVVSRFKLLDNLAYHLDSSSSFIATWLPCASAVYATSTMMDDERNAVSGWIGALFGEGISDDLMHATNPRTLLRVAPTILKQSLKARQAGIVDMDSLRDALSYFLQELLRFTLPGVLKWLITEIERTPPSPQQNSMLDLLQVLVFSDALPSAVLELVALDLARLLLSPTFASNVSPAVDIARLRKTIAPYRPPPPAIQATIVDEHAAFEAASKPFLSGAQAIEGEELVVVAIPSLYDSLRLSLRTAKTPSIFFSRTFLPQIFFRPQANGEHVTPGAYSRRERYAAAVLAAPDSNNRPLVVNIVWALTPQDLAEWDRRLLPAGTTDGLVGGEAERMQVELLGDAIAGAVVLVKGEAEASATPSSAQHLSATLDELARRVEEVRRSRKSSTADVQDEEKTTALDAFLDRLLSWPAVVEHSPRLSALAAE